MANYHKEDEQMNVGRECWQPQPNEHKWGFPKSRTSALNRDVLWGFRLQNTPVQCAISTVINKLYIMICILICFFFKFGNKGVTVFELWQKTVTALCYRQFLAVCRGCKQSAFIFLKWEEPPRQRSLFLQVVWGSWCLGQKLVNAESANC